MVYAMSPPARHHTILWWCAGLGPDTKPHGGPVIYEDFPRHEQGFITNQGMFVDRYEARRIATAAGQLQERASNLPQLFSEDVW